METDLQPQANESRAFREGTANYLRDVYLRKRKSNPSYSLRSFARNLDVPAGRLSEIFSGKRQLTPSLASKIGERLSMNPEERAQFLESVVFEKKSRSINPSLATATPTRKDMSVDAFSVIAEWQHFALYSLIQTKDFQNDPTWISKRLGISPVQVRDSLERLMRLGMIEIGPMGRIIHSDFSWHYSVDTGAIRKFHAGKLQLAVEALENVHKDQREYFSSSLKFNPRKMAKAKKLLQDFGHKFSREMEKGESSEVYSFNLQFFPMTRLEQEGVSP